MLELIEGFILGNLVWRAHRRHVWLIMEGGIQISKDICEYRDPSDCVLLLTLWNLGQPMHRQAIYGANFFPATTGESAIVFFQQGGGKPENLTGLL